MGREMRRALVPRSLAQLSFDGQIDCIWLPNIQAFQRLDPSLTLPNSRFVFRDLCSLHRYRGGVGVGKGVVHEATVPDESVGWKVAELDL